MILVLLRTSQFRSSPECKYCFPDNTVLGASESDSREVLAGASPDADTPSSAKILGNHPTILADRATSLPVLDRCPYHLSSYCSESRNWSPSTGLLVLRCRTVDGLKWRLLLGPAVTMLEM